MRGGARKPKAPKERKPRPTPSLDKALALVQRISTVASDQRWSPKMLRKELRKARCVCRSVWAKAIRSVFGAGIRELPDRQQLSLFGGR